MNKALFITHMLERNGAPLVLLQMIDTLTHQGYNADVISLYDGILREDLAARGISVRIVSDPTHDFENLKSQLCGYDLVVCNTLITVPFVLMLHETRVPTLWWIHEGRSYFEKYKKILTLAKMEEFVEIVCEYEEGK